MTVWGEMPHWCRGRERTVHTIVTTSANIHDVTVASELIPKDDEVIYGDPGYLGIQKRPKVANDEHLATTDYCVNLRTDIFSKANDNAIDWICYIERCNSTVCCKVEHVFRIIKCQFGHKKVRYQGLKKRESTVCHACLRKSLRTGNC